MCFPKLLLCVIVQICLSIQINRWGSWSCQIREVVCAGLPESGIWCPFHEAEVLSCTFASPKPCLATTNGLIRFHTNTQTHTLLLLHILPIVEWIQCFASKSHSATCLYYSILTACSLRMRAHTHTHLILCSRQNFTNLKVLSQHTK